MGFCPFWKRISEAACGLLKKKKKQQNHKPNHQQKTSFFFVHPFFVLVVSSYHLRGHLLPLQLCAGAGAGHLLVQLCQLIFQRLDLAAGAGHQRCRKTMPRGVEKMTQGYFFVVGSFVGEFDGLKKNGEIWASNGPLTLGKHEPIIWDLSGEEISTKVQLIE